MIKSEILANTIYQINRKPRYNSPLLSSAAPSSWGMDKLANTELFPLQSMSSSDDSGCSSLNPSSGSLTPVLCTDEIMRQNKMNGLHLIIY